MSTSSACLAIHAKAIGGRFHEGDPVTVTQDCSARTPGPGGKWEHIRQHVQGHYKYPVHGNNNRALVAFQFPGSKETRDLEIDPANIGHLFI